MKKAKCAVAVALACLSLAMICPQAQAQAAGSLLNDVITMSPGESQVREFAIYDAFDIKNAGPVESYLVIGASADNATKFGDLIITVKPASTKPFGAIVGFNLIGIAYPFGGAPAFFNVKSDLPLSSAKTIKMRTNYAFALVGTYITAITGDVIMPVQFSITFAWAVAK
jgi:hypothetical protein